MKKYFYYVMEYRTNIEWHFLRSIAGVCESSDDGLFPIVQVTGESFARLKARWAACPSEDEVVLDPDSVRVVNTVEISKDDYLMMNYEEIHGKDSKK